MKNLSILFFILIPLLASANEFEECLNPAVPEILESKHYEMIQQISDQGKRDFKRRPYVNPAYLMALNIETNFEAPLIGRDPYWGRIYFNEKDDYNIYYRDDLTAEKYYNNEKNNPKTFWQSTFNSQDINSSKGLYLVKAMGAVVNVKSLRGDFSPKTGGRINIKVKAPKTNALNVMVNVKRSGKNITKELVVDDKMIAFDSFKINAARSMFGISILNGVDSIEFMKGGKVVHRITQ